MRTKLWNAALASMLAIGASAGLGGSTARAQGYGGYPGVYGGYVAQPLYGGYVAPPLYGGGGYLGGYNSGYNGGYYGVANRNYHNSYRHHHHRHHRGCGHY